MRSQGPFKIYDHSHVKGQQYVQNLNETNNQAHERFIKECEHIREVRKFEKKQFGWQKKKQDIVASHNQNLVKEKNFKNLSFLSDQIQKDQQRKEKQKYIDKQYYKPHFGPEETDDLLDQERERMQTQKDLIKGHLIQ